ncbi:MAG: MerC family mercury resistance protein, partial [Sediminibacterium sp.]|nr:MerC family mercury resistance protein [Sediminibacterium sp.]
MKLKINWDRMGISAALICAIHCAIFPLLSTGFPFLFSSFANHNSWFDSIMILISFFIGIFNLYHGKKKHHHKYLPIILFSIGICLLVIRFFV